MSEDCPTCGGPRIVDHPDHLAAYEHRAGCALARVEDETLRADAERAQRRRAVRHRNATRAERLLVAASGVRVDQRQPLFVRVEMVDTRLRLRTFSRAGLVAADEASS